MKVIAITDPTTSPSLQPSGLDEDNLLRVIDGKIAEEERMGEGQHRRDRPRAKSQRENRGHGERRAAAHAADRIANVLESGFQRRHAARLPALFFESLSAKYRAQAIE